MDETEYGALNLDLDAELRRLATSCLLVGFGAENAGTQGEVAELAPGGAYHRPTVSAASGVSRDIRYKRPIREIIP